MRELSNDEMVELEKKREERKNLLTPDQLIVVERWDAEKAKRQELLNQALEEDDVVRKWELLRAVCEVSFLKNPGRCEHDRSIMGSCLACEEIERILTPELFEEED